MVQQINDFIEYCKSIGLLQKEEEFQEINEDLGQMLFMYLLTLNRQSLIDLSHRVADNWRESQKPKSEIPAYVKFSGRNKHSCSTPQESIKSMIQSNNQSTNHLYDQFIESEEKKIMKSQKIINEQLKECTFQPQIQRKSQQLDSSAPVYDRLSQFGCDQRVKQQISMEAKSKSELKQCTFRPQVNHHPSNSLNGDPFSRLYQNALSQRQTKPKSNEKVYTFKPQLVSQPLIQQEYISLPVEDRLYNHFFDQQQNLVQKQENEKQAELDQCTFTPQINQYGSILQESDSKGKVFERLYNKSSSMKSHSEIRENTQQLSINRQSDKIIKQANYDSSKYVSQFKVDQSPYDRLYSEHKRVQRKKKVKENEVFSNIPFKPYINKK